MISNRKIKIYKINSPLSVNFYKKTSPNEKKQRSDIAKRKKLMQKKNKPLKVYMSAFRFIKINRRAKTQSEEIPNSCNLPA
jgi:hypothetical protein